MSKTLPSEKVKKTRYRTPTSCDQCRKRKLKCDRQRPCSNCTKSGTEDLCKYAPSAKWNAMNASNIMKMNLNNEIIKLRLKINKLEKILELNNIDLSKYDNILNDPNDYYENENIDDPMVSLSEKFDSMMVKENRLLHSGTTSYVTFIVRDKHLVEMFEACTKRNILIYNSYNQQQKIKASDFLMESTKTDPTWLQIEATTSEGENINLSSVTNLNAKLVMDVLKEVNAKLPPLYVVNALVDRFFQYVYTLLPFVNEEIFRDELSYVLVPIENGACKVSITHLQNTSIVSLLLCVLRYAYLTINMKDYTGNNIICDNKIILDMVKNGISIDYDFIVLSKNLLMALPSDDSIFKKITLRNVQVLLYLRLYQSYSPELNDEGRENSLTLALIIQMCRAVGANIDRDNFPHIFKDQRTITVWRRVFYKLLNLDVHNAFDYGCPLMISDDEYDIKLPTLNEKDLAVLTDFRKGLPVSKTTTEIRKLIIENAINKDTALEYDAVKLIRSGLSVFQNFKASFKKSKFVKIVDQMQEFIDKKIPSLWEILQDTYTGHSDGIYDTPKVHKFEIRLTMQSILMTFYYLLYLNEQSEQDNNSSFSDDESTDESKNGRSFHLTNKYGIRALELSLSILKMNYDYTKYVSQSNVPPADLKQHNALKNFSCNCDVLILNRIAVILIRPFLFLSSVFLQNIQVQNGLTFEEVIQAFSNSIDSAIILKWFNVNSSVTEELSKTDQEFSFLLFQYIKDLFFMSYNIKDKYFVCWRNTLTIKLFVNYFKYRDPKLYSEFMHPKFVFDDADNIMGRNLTPEEASHFIENSYLNLEETEPSSTGTYMQDFFDTTVPDMNMMNFDNVGNNLDCLIYNDLDTMLDDMFRDSDVRLQVPRDFDIFNMNQMNTGTGQIIVANIETMDKTKTRIEAKFNNLVHENGPPKNVDPNVMPTPDLNVFTDSSVADAIQGMKDQKQYDGLFY